MAVKTSKTSKYDDGLAFRFDFPDELSLSAADVIDGVPKLRFVPSLHVPSVTEEDVAVCVRLSQEKTRPEFYYSNFPFNHPFYGRHYKDYRPSYLRGTSVGEVLAEADWQMKCLNAGVKSDKTKTEFKPWSENSRLEGLATSEHFSSTPAYAVGVYMTCESVELKKSEEEILFGDPKMAIQVSNSSSYTKYLTEIFDAIAYYDEPLFLKVKELIKLILAIEWFVNEKGVNFSAEWVNEHLKRSQTSARQAIAVKSPKLTQEIVDYVLEQFPQVATAPLALPTGEIPAIQMPMPWSIVKIPPIQISASKTMTDKTFQIKHVRKIDGPGVSNELSFTLTVSVDDYDTLYQGMDPNTPIYNGEFVVPNVASWSELFAESVPIPCKSLLTSNGEMVNTVGGGVTTQSIPVRQTTTKAKAAAEKVVSASSHRKRQRIKNPTTPSPQLVPSTNVACEQQQQAQRVLNEGGFKHSHGVMDQTCHRNGQKPAVRSTMRMELSGNGQHRSVTLFDDHAIPSNLVENQSKDPTKPSAQHRNSSATEVSRPQQESLAAQQLSPPLEQPAAGAEVAPTVAEAIPIAAEESLVGGKKSPNGGSPTGSDDESTISDDKAGNSGIMSPTDGLLSPVDKADDGTNFEFTDVPGSPEN